MPRYFTGRFCLSGTPFRHEHTDVLISRYNLADVLEREGRSAEAEKLFRETVAEQTRVLGAENPDTLASEASLAKVLVSEGRYREAQTMARQALDIELRTLGVQHADSLATMEYLGMALASEHKYGEAQTLFNDTIQQLKKDGASTLPVAWYRYACVAELKTTTMRCSTCGKLSEVDIKIQTTCWWTTT